MPSKKEPDTTANTTADSAHLTAAMLTLSESVDALFHALRQTLSLHVTETGHKIPETFLPPHLSPTADRFERWKDHLK